MYTTLFHSRTCNFRVLHKWVSGKASCQTCWVLVIMEWLRWVKRVLRKSWELSFQVVPNLYIGSAKDAQDQVQVTKARISHVVSAHTGATRHFKVQLFNISMCRIDIIIRMSPTYFFLLLIAPSKIFHSIFKRYHLSKCKNHHENQNPGKWLHPCCSGQWWQRSCTLVSCARTDLK